MCTTENKLWKTYIAKNIIHIELPEYKALVFPNRCVKHINYDLQFLWFKYRLLCGEFVFSMNLKIF